MTYLYLDQFKEYFTLKGYASKSVQNYSKVLTYFLTWLSTQNMELSEVRHTDILAYIDYKKKKGNIARSLQYTLNALNHFFTYLVNEHQYNENPCSNILIRGIKRQVLYDILTPQELDELYKSYPPPLNIAAGRTGPPQEKNALARKRNKLVLSLLIYQGIKPEEAYKLELSDLHLREGKLTVQGGLRSNTRTLKLESHQIIDLSDYVNDTRKHILSLTNKTSTKLFTNMGTSTNYNNVLQSLLKTLQHANPKLKTLKHIRTSVITNWLKTHKLRKTQYLAGHRYVSSTESYQANNIDELKEALKKYHPLI
jgi:site-specific recombinase XerD